MPAWVQRGGWTPVPNSFFTHVMRACSQFEQAILSLILFRTAGDAQGGRPEWVQLSEQQLARFLDGHPNGISKAIGRLEEMGAIESRKVGRAKQYRAIVEAWDKLTPRKPRKVEPKRVEEPEEDADAELRDEEAVAALKMAAAPKEVLVILPGQKKPRPLAETCPGGANCELVRRYAAKDKRMTSTPECGDSGETANTGRTTTTLEWRNASPAVPSDAAADRNPPPTLLDPEFSAFYDLIDSLLSTRLLQPPPLAILETQFERLKAHDVPLDYVEARVKLRINAFRSYGLLEHVVTDCIKAVDAARANDQRATNRGGAAAPDAAAIRKHLRACADTLKRQPLDAGYEDVRELVLQAAEDAPRHAADLVHLELHLANAEAMMRNLAEDALSPEERSAIEGDVERQVRPYRDRMSHEQFSSLRAEIYLRRLFEHARLPRLSLFYAEGAA
jgi:hypothetical protein